MISTSLTFHSDRLERKTTIRLSWKMTLKPATRRMRMKQEWATCRPKPFESIEFFFSVSVQSLDCHHSPLFMAGASSSGGCAQERQTGCTGGCSKAPRSSRRSEKEGWCVLPWVCFPKTKRTQVCFQNNMVSISLVDSIAPYMRFKKKACQTVRTHVRLVIEEEPGIIMDIYGHQSINQGKMTTLTSGSLNYIYLYSQNPCPRTTLSPWRKLSLRRTFKNGKVK